MKQACQRLGWSKGWGAQAYCLHPLAPMANGFPETLPGSTVFGEAPACCVAWEVLPTSHSGTSVLSQLLVLLWEEPGHQCVLALRIEREPCTATEEGRGGSPAVN